MKVFYNRTLRYLGPILNTYPKLFKESLNKTKFNMAICDALYYKATKKSFQKYLFIQFRYNQELINICRGLKLYVDDYPLDLNNNYVVVLDIPPEYESAYDFFLKGQYSKMYSESELEKLKVRQILNGQLNNTYLVLTHNDLAYDEYCKVILELYKTNSIPDKESVLEFDIPPQINKEVFNHRGNIEWVKENTPLKLYISV